MRRLITPRLALFAVGHFSIDAYSSYFTPLLPLLVARLHLSLAAVGGLVALAAISSSFGQLAFGLLTDRIRRPWFTALGPLVAGVFLSSIGLASSYGALFALLMLGGAGVAMFHPQTAVMASASGRSRAVGMSVFVTGGTLGFALGPTFAVLLESTVGLERSYLGAIPGILVTLLLLSQFGRLDPNRSVRRERARLSGLRPVLKPLALLYVAVVCRSAVSYGFMTFLPIHLHRRGFAVTTGGHLLTLYLGAGALGGFLGGWLADRWGGRRVILNSFIAALPLYVAFLFLPDGPGLASLTLGSFLLQGSLPVNVVLGQELSPRHSSTISSLLMGAAWGLGALLIGPVGVLADGIGLKSALLALTSLLAVGVACGWALPASVDVIAPAPPVELAVAPESPAR
jgi:MFS transporter, FSR family, fosmidomycin resistance protein